MRKYTLAQNRDRKALFRMCAAAVGLRMFSRRLLKEADREGPHRVEAKVRGNVERAAKRVRPAWGPNSFAESPCAASPGSVPLHPRRAPR